MKELECTHAHNAKEKLWQMPCTCRHEWCVCVCVCVGVCECARAHTHTL